MKTRFIVIHGKGLAWEPSKLRRSQRQWDEHAEFMDKLTAEGFVVLGGPLGEGDGEDAMLVIDAPTKRQSPHDWRKTRGRSQEFWW